MRHYETAPKEFNPTLRRLANLFLETWLCHDLVTPHAAVPSEEEHINLIGTTEPHIFVLQRVASPDLTGQSEVKACSREGLPPREWNAVLQPATPSTTQAFEDVDERNSLQLAERESNDACLTNLVKS